jgi:chromate transport protein ChrA
MNNLIFDFRWFFYPIFVLVMIWGAVEYARYRKSFDPVAKVNHLTLSIYLAYISIVLFLVYSLDDALLGYFSFLPYPFSILLLGFFVYLLSGIFKHYLRILIAHRFIKSTSK